jgi:hypothetical protein
VPTKSEWSVIRFLASNPSKPKDVIIKSTGHSGGFALARLIQSGVVEVTNGGLHILTDRGQSSATGQKS